LLQAPQLAGSILVSTHLLPQLAVPPRHSAAQVPAEQCWPVAQACPQLPQLAGSKSVSTQAPPHSLEPPLQFTPQALFEQSCPAGQALPQAPQLAGSKAVLVQTSPHSVAPGQTGPLPPAPEDELEEEDVVSVVVPVRPCSPTAQAEKEPRIALAQRIPAPVQVRR
jgi:hypothetical protein